MAKNIITDTNVEKHFDKITSDILDVDFDVSMGMHHSYGYYTFFKTQNNRMLYNFFRNIYNKNKPSNIINDGKTKIPKIIHQIWIGPKPFPIERKIFSKKWQEFHPDWEYRFWTDTEVANFDFSLRELYEQSSNYGQKADLLRYELLRQYGGLYVDIDFECLKSFDEFNKKYHFYTGLLPPHKSIIAGYPLEVAIALLGSCANHPIIEETIALIHERWNSIYNAQNYTDKEKIFLSTMYPLKDSLLLSIQNKKFSNIVMPATYFYPILPKNLRCVLNNCIDPCFSQIARESMALHHWDQSWC